MTRIWPLYAYVSLVALIAALPSIATSDFRLPSLESEEWSAWVQAVGSVLAILVSTGLAIMVPAHQDKTRRQESQALAMLAIVNASQEMTGYLSAAAMLVENNSINNGTYPMIAAAVRSTDSDVQSLRSTEIPSSARVHLIALRTNIFTTLMLLDNARDALGKGGKVSKDYFREAGKLASDRQRALLAYLTANPVGKTPLPGYH